MPESAWYPEPWAWSDPCRECQNKLLCNDEGMCKRCYTHTWPIADLVEVETAIQAVKRPSRPRCLQCFASQDQAPGEACKHPAWHDLPRSEPGEHTELADAV